MLNDELSVYTQIPKEMLKSVEKPGILLFFMNILINLEENLIYLNLNIGNN